MGKLDGNRIVSCRSLKSVVSKVVCSACLGPIALDEDMVTRRGLVTKLFISCTKCGLITDPYKEAKSLNSRSILAGREIGRGRTSLARFLGLMDLPPTVSDSNYRIHNQALAEASLASARANMHTSSQVLHQMHNTRPDEVLDITVTCDGTWSKRGFTVKYSVVVVIAWETGQVLDFQNKSKCCLACQGKLTKVDFESEEFKEWYEGHKDQCDANYSGSSPAMEAEAALDIWRRSEKQLRLRYTEVISDGDSKMVTKLQESKPYGENTTITKCQCVGHVQKRVGTEKRVKEVTKKQRVTRWQKEKCLEEARIVAEGVTYERGGF